GIVRRAGVPHPRGELSPHRRRPKSAAATPATGSLRFISPHNRPPPPAIIPRGQKGPKKDQTSSPKGLPQRGQPAMSPFAPFAFARLAFLLLQCASEAIARISGS